MNAVAERKNPAQDTVILGVLTLPFLLNDFANIYVRDYRLWLAIDYVLVRVFPLSVIWFLVRSGKLNWSDVGIRRNRFGPFLVWTINLTVLGILLDQFGGRFFAQVLPDTAVGGLPSITDPLARQIQLYFGLTFVGLAEEVVFRGLYFTLLSAHLRNRAAVFWFSALAFGVIHWSLGVSSIANAAVIGAVFMTCMANTGSVLPTVVAHFFVNYVAFSGLLGPR